MKQAWFILITPNKTRFKTRHIRYLFYEMRNCWCTSRIRSHSGYVIRIWIRRLETKNLLYPAIRCSSVGTKSLEYIILEITKNISKNLKYSIVPTLKRQMKDVSPLLWFPQSIYCSSNFFWWSDVSRFYWFFHYDQNANR